MGRESLAPSSRRAINWLTALRVQNLREPGYHCDGGGLYLRVTVWGSKSWAFRFTSAKRTREMDLGPFPAMSLAAARVAAQRCRESLVAGGRTLIFENLLSTSYWFAHERTISNILDDRAFARFSIRSRQRISRT